MNIAEQYEKDFEQLKKELKFKATREELEEIFFVSDFLQEKGYVSANLARQISWRIADLFNSWTGYIHGIIVPNPGSMVSMTESSLYDEQEKAKLIDIMNAFMAITTENGLIGLKKDKKAQAQYIDNAVTLWNKHKAELLNIAQRTHDAWKQKASTPAKAKKPESHYG